MGVPLIVLAGTSLFDLGEVGPGVCGGEFVGEYVTSKATLHPIINEPTIPMNLIQHTIIPPFEKTRNGRAMTIKHIQIAQIAILGRGNIPQDIVIFHHGTTHITYDHDHLICESAPGPISLVMGIVTLNKRMICHAIIDKVPFVPGWPSSQCLHLGKGHALIARRKSGNESFVKVDIVGNIVSGWFPFTCTAAQVEGEMTLPLAVETGGNVNGRSSDGLEILTLDGGWLTSEGVFEDWHGRFKVDYAHHHSRAYHGSDRLDLVDHRYC